MGVCKLKINFTLFRSKNPNEEITSGTIIQPIEDTILPVIDTYINKLIIAHTKQLEIVKHYGIAYVGSIKLNSLEITNEDEIELNEEGFKNYIQNLFTNVEIKWNKDVKNEGDGICIKQQEKPVKVKKKE